MEIVDIRTTPIAIPYVSPQVRPHRKFWDKRVSTIIEVFTDEDGLVGISEAPGGNPRHIQYEIDNVIKPRILGMEPFEIERIIGVEYYYQGPSPVALSAIEIACWDIIGKSLKTPVYKLMGGKLWDKVAITNVTSINNPDIVASECVKAVENGIQAIKIKVGRHPKQDLAIVKAAREAVGDDIILRVDPNRSWSVLKAAAMINKMEKYYPQFIENPTPTFNFDEFRRLKKMIRVPLCVCDSHPKHPEVLRLIKAEAMDALSTEPYRVGGILGFKKVTSTCDAEGIPVICHMSSFGVSQAAYLHSVITNHACKYPHDIKCSNLVAGARFVDDIVKEPLKHKNGYLSVPEGPGLGVELDPEKVRKWAKYYEELQKKPPKLSSTEMYEGPNLSTNYYYPPRH